MIPDRPPSAAFAGIESRRARPEQQERAHLNTKRHWRDRRIAAKLDALLGPVDDEEQPA